MGLVVCVVGAGRIGICTTFGQQESRQIVHGPMRYGRADDTAALTLLLHKASGDQQFDMMGQGRSGDARTPAQRTDGQSCRPRAHQNA